MVIEMWVGLNVVDDGSYEAYREAMRPILDSYGGSFRIDVRVADVLHSETPDPINRLFCLRFPDEQRRDDFFGDETYKKVRARTFDAAVSHTTIVATYTT